MKKTIFLVTLILFSSTSCLLAQEVSITQLPGGEITTQYYDSPNGEGIDKLIDNNINTKFLSFNPSLWIVYKAPSPHIVTSYALTSANDAASRDPKKWKLEGSNNGVSWFPLDAQDNITFSARKQTRTFNVAENETAYLYYRLTILTVVSGTTFQLAEWQLKGIAGEMSKDVFADFVVEPPYETTQPILISNASLNAVSYNWEFVGGKPATSLEENPSVVYSNPGTYEIVLTASDGTNTSTKIQTIKVEKYQDWSSFRAPTVVIENNFPGNAGYIKYLALVKSKGYASIEEFVQKCCLTIAKELYYTPYEARLVDLQKITYKFNEGGALSYKGGSPPNIEIGFDLNYITSFAANHSDDASADEIYGVLCHEICHGYQASPKNCGGYQNGTEYFGYIEGSADLARLLTGGFNPRRFPKLGGHWTDGYNTTAFFYQWITDYYSANFLKDLNETAKRMDTWSLDAATKKLFKKSAQQLWDEYQHFLKTGELTNSSHVEVKNDINVSLGDGSKLTIQNLSVGDVLRIYTLTGKPVFFGKASGESETVSVGALVRGLYLLNVSNSRYNVAMKFVK